MIKDKLDFMIKIDIFVSKNDYGNTKWDLKIEYNIYNPHTS